MIYTQYQLLILILFKDYQNQHYRDSIQDVEGMESIQDELDFTPGPIFDASEIFLPNKKTCISATRKGRL
jgi:hypothetical protein